MSESETTQELNERIMKAFREAYPDISNDEIEHMARNFIQVVNGILGVGEKSETAEKPDHMDIANSMIYWCVANTSLEDYLEGDSEAITADPTIARLTEEEMLELLKEFVARAADWLIGLEELRQDPELFKLFIKGALAFGAEDWENKRDKLGH